MSTKELLLAEIDQLKDAELEELYRIVKNFNQPQKPQELTLMEKLMRIKIDAPEDFSANFDQYASGEKRVKPDIS